MPASRLVFVGLLLQRDHRRDLEAVARRRAGRPRSSRSPRASARASGLGRPPPTTCRWRQASRRPARGSRCGSASTIGVADSRAHMSGYGRAAASGHRSRLSLLLDGHWSLVRVAGPGRGAAAAPPRVVRAARTTAGTPAAHDGARALGAWPAPSPARRARRAARSASALGVGGARPGRRVEPGRVEVERRRRARLDDLGRAQLARPVEQLGRGPGRPRRVDLLGRQPAGVDDARPSRRRSARGRPSRR